MAAQAPLELCSVVRVPFDTPTIVEGMASEAVVLFSMTATGALSCGFLLGFVD